MKQFSIIDLACNVCCKPRPVNLMARDVTDARHQVNRYMNSDENVCHLCEQTTTVNTLAETKIDIAYFGPEYQKPGLKPDLITDEDGTVHHVNREHKPSSWQVELNRIQKQLDIPNPFAFLASAENVGGNCWIVFTNVISNRMSFVVNGEIKQVW